MQQPAGFALHLGAHAGLSSLVRTWRYACRSVAPSLAAGSSLARQLAQAGIHAEARVATGHVPSEIVACAEETDADLVVMSTHALVWPTQAYIGSVANAVLRTGRRPVLLVRREPVPGDVSDVGSRVEMLPLERS